MRRQKDLNDSPLRAFKTREALRGVARDHDRSLGVEVAGAVIATPGKSTLTSGLTASTEVLVQLQRTLASATCDATNLEQANRTGDFKRASWAMAGLKRFIAQVPQLMEMLPRGGSGDFEGTIQALVQRARTALDAAPTTSEAARQAADRGDFAQWRAEVDAWRAKAGVVAKAEPAVDRQPRRDIASPLGSTGWDKPAAVAKPGTGGEAANSLSANGARLQGDKPVVAPELTVDVDATTTSESAVSSSASASAESGSSVDSTDVQDVAAQGLADGGGAMPHSDAIARSFGPEFDISDVQAHVGGAAARATDALGAHAYAAGNRIAFATAPDLHTAAHEATHAVLQMRGVAPAGGIGSSHDVFERHADAVADAVVAGKPAAPILTQMTGGARATGSTRFGRTAAIQLKAAKPNAVETFVNSVRSASLSDGANEGDDEPAPRRPTALEAFLAINEVDIRDAVAKQLREYGWPDPADDVHFSANGETLFSQQLYRQLKPTLTSAKSLQPLVSPGNIVQEFHRLVDKSRAQDASEFGKSVAQLLQWSARDSLVDRIGPEYRRQWAKNVDPPSAQDLATKHPMDALVAAALATPGVIDLREMPELDIPMQAPMVSKPVAKEKKSKTPVVSARHQTGQPPTVRQLMDIELDVGKRLDLIRDQVAPLGLGEQLHHAVEVRAERVQNVAGGDAAALAHYLPILQFQHTQLIAISDALPKLLAEYWPLHGLPDFALTASKRADRSQLQSKLAHYVRAAAVSDDKEQSTAILKEIEVTQRQQARRSFDAAQRDAERATAEVVTATPNRSPAGTASGLDMMGHQRQAMLDGTAKGRSEYERQKAVTVGGEVALNARMQTAEHALEQLRQAAIEVYGDEEGMLHDLPGCRSLPFVVRDVQDHLNDVRRTWDHEISEHSGDVQDDPNAPDDWSDWKARGDALPVAQQAYARIAGDQELVAFFREVQTKIRHQRIINAAKQLAVALAITVATGMGAAMLGESVAAAIAAEGSSLGMRALALGANITVNATINTAVQLAISQPIRNRSLDATGKEVEESDGRLVGSMLLENMLMDMFTRAIAAPLRQMQNLALKEGQLLSTLPHLSKSEAQTLSSFKFAGTGLAIEFISGMSAQWAARHLVESFKANGEEVSEPFAVAALQQGAAIGLGKFFHGQLAAWKQHQHVLEHLSNGHSSQAKRLFAERTAFYERAKALADSLSPDPTDLHALIDLNVRLIADEHALVSPAGRKPEAKASADRWINELRSQLTAEGEKMLAEFAQGKTALEVMNTYGGDFDSALKSLGRQGTARIPDTAERFTVGPLPKFGEARWKYLEDPSHWKPERAALHDQLLAAAKLHGRAFADTLVGKEPTLYAMRGNTAAGKTRAVSGNVAELAGPMQSTTDFSHRAVNPDSFKADLIKATPGATSTDVHSESSMLAGRLEKELLDMKTADGQPASMLIDKRLLTVEDVRGYAELAKTSGRKFVLYDVDAPLEHSLAGVLERAPGETDPLPPFDIVERGFEAVRANRGEVIDLFMDMTTCSYRLFGTTTRGDRVEIAMIEGGHLAITDGKLFWQSTAEPDELLATTRITHESTAELTKDFATDRASKIRGILEQYEGWTWKAALDAHSREKTP